MEAKAIFLGWLEFGSQKTFDKVLEMYEQRSLNFFRAEVFLKKEDIFEEEHLRISVYKYKAPGIHRRWKNTVELLEYFAQFAVSGTLYTWFNQEGKVLDFAAIKPKNVDRQTVRHYQKGAELMEENGQLSEAVSCFSKAIRKQPNHAEALERRGFAKFLLGDESEAFEDVNKAIESNPLFAQAYFSRGQMLLAQKDYKNAASDFDFAIKHSVPMMTQYWASRRLKASCLINLNEFDQARKEYRLFCGRTFKKDSSNYLAQQKACYDYAKLLVEVNEYEESLNMITKSLQLSSETESTLPLADILLLRGIVMQKLGKKGFVGALKEAAQAGSEKAANLLQEVN